jgi:hypothetical protein
MRFHRLDVTICLFLIVASMAVFSQVRNYDFVNYNDNRYVTENRHVQAGLTWDGAVWAFTTTHASNWHPLTWLSHMLGLCAQRTSLLVLYLMVRGPGAFNMLGRIHVATSCERTPSSFLLRSLDR